MKRGRYLHILSYLHFTDNRNEPDRTGDNYDRLWKIWDLFEILNNTFSKFYNTSKNQAIDEVIVSFKGRVVFKQYIPKKHVSASKFSNFVTQLDTRVTWKCTWGKDRQRTAQHLTATHATVPELTRKVEGQNRACDANPDSAQVSESAQLNLSTSSNLATYYWQFTSQLRGAADK